MAPFNYTMFFGLPQGLVLPQSPDRLLSILPKPNCHWKVVSENCGDRDCCMSLPCASVLPGTIGTTVLGVLFAVQCLTLSGEMYMKLLSVIALGETGGERGGWGVLDVVELLNSVLSVFVLSQNRKQ